MSKRGILGFIYTLQAIKAHGADLTCLSARYGINLDNLSPDKNIERALELRIYCDVLPSLDDELSGLKIGQTMSLAGYGPFIMLLMTCNNAWDAFHTGIHFQTLTYLFGEMYFTAAEKECLLCIKPGMLPPICRRFLIDRDASGTYQLIRDLQTSIGVDLKPSLIRLPYPKPADTQPYEQRFQCPIEFGSNEIQFVLPTEYLATPFPAANTMAHSLYQKQCESLAQTLSSSHESISQQAQDYLSLFVDTFPTIQEVATTFGMAERSFRRKLSEENLTFRKLLDEVRFKKALHLLKQSNLSIEAISSQLGYAESSAFIHAFQRWSNLTPAKFRALSAL